jgi:hypothetical protein
MGVYDFNSCSKMLGSSEGMASIELKQYDTVDILISR